jgi:hypothetical protein
MLVIDPSMKSRTWLERDLADDPADGQDESVENVTQFGLPLSFFRACVE